MKINMMESQEFITLGDVLSGTISENRFSDNLMESRDWSPEELESDERKR